MDEEQRKLKPQIDWKPHEQTLRETYPSATAAQVAKKLEDERGVRVSKGAVANKAHQLGLRKTPPPPPPMRRR